MKIKILGVWYENLIIIHMDARADCYIIYDISGEKGKVTKILFFSQWDVEEIYMGYDNNTKKYT
jgi:hypothetical protein